MDEWLDLQDLLDKGEDLLEMGFYREALDLLDTYRDAYSDEWEVYLLYGRLYFEEQELDNAERAYHEGLRRNPHNPECLVGMFFVMVQQDTLETGFPWLEEGYRFHPDNESVLSALIWYYLEVNDLRNVHALFDKTRSLSFENPDIFRNAGVAFERSGEYERAEYCFSSALRISPFFDEARDLLADHYILRGFPEKSVSLYREHLKGSPKNITTLSRLVFCLSQTGDNNEAQEVSQTIIRYYPNSPVGYVDLAYVFLNNQQYDKAQQAITRALDVAPMDAEAYRVRGIICTETHEFDLAEESFQKAMDLGQNNVEILRDYYTFLQSSGNFQLMEQYVFMVIEQEHPYCMEDYWFLAEHYRDTGQNLKAFHYLHLAQKVMPGDVDIIPPIVDILLEEGHTAYSLPILMRYVERVGWDDVMNTFARHKRFKKGMNQEAIRFLRFLGQKPDEFRRFLFLAHARRFITLSMMLLFLAGSVLFLLFRHSPGVRSIIPLTVGSGLVWILLQLYVRKKYVSLQPGRPEEKRVSLQSKRNFT